MAETDSAAPVEIPDIPPPPADTELARLRSLLLEREIVLLEHLKKRLDNPIEHARDVSNVIAEALLLRTGKDDRLNVALEPSIETTFKAMLRKRPQDVTDVLFPIIGGTIRRSIAESFRSMLENFNQSLELSFSLKGLRWRLEALRSGKPFSEIVLLHTLLYRVEQVFFIHSETGLLLAHAVDEEVEAQDADMVSAMLTAIQDFVRDCFAKGQEGHLDSLRLGDFTIFIERSPQAHLACVVRGTPPADFRAMMSTALEVLLVEYADALDSFKGDNSPFQGGLRHLRDCLISKSHAVTKPIPLWRKILLLCVLLALAGSFGWYRYEAHLAEQELAAQQQLEQQRIAEQHQLEQQRITEQLQLEQQKLIARQQLEQQRLAAHRQRLEHGVSMLQKEPGYVLFEVKRAEDYGPWELFCLKDSMARPFEDILQKYGYSDTDYSIHTTPYMSYLPEFVRLRAERKIKPPDTVSLRLDDNGVLHLSGTAHLGWILQARQAALSLTGITDVNTRDLKDKRNERLLELVRTIENTSILFPLGKTAPDPPEMAKLTVTCDNLAELDRLATSMGMVVSLTIYGHADAVGNDKRNYELSQERAKSLASLLYARGTAIPITLYGMGADYADQNKKQGDGDQSSRRIELRVRLMLAPETELEILQGQQQP